MPDPRCFECKKKWQGPERIPPGCYTNGRCPKGVIEIPGKDQIDTWLS